MARPVGRPAKLTRQQVARAAFDLADAEGPGAVTIGRLARELDVGPMTLYGYAESKDAIIAMVLDLLLADLPELDPARSWRDALEVVFVAIYRRLVGHRNVTRLVAQSPTFGAAQAHMVDAILARLAAEGVPEEEAFEIQRTLGSYMVGYALFIGDERGSEAEFRRGLRRILG